MVVSAFWHDLWLRMCHIGVTRVKEVNLAKSLLLLQFTWYCHVTHAYGSPKFSLYRLYTKKYQRSFGVTRSNTKVKFQTTSSGKTNGANMLPLDKHAKVFTLTSSSDLRLRGQRLKRDKFQTTLNCKTCLGQTCKGIHSDLFVRPTVKESKVKKGKISNQKPI